MSGALIATTSLCAAGAPAALEHRAKPLILQAETNDGIAVIFRLLQQIPTVQTSS